MPASFRSLHLDDLARDILVLALRSQKTYSFARKLRTPWTARVGSNLKQPMNGVSADYLPLPEYEYASVLNSKGLLKSLAV